jgi:hypothetical protein
LSSTTSSQGAATSRSRRRTRKSISSEWQRFNSFLCSVGIESSCRRTAHRSPACRLLSQVIEMLNQVLPADHFLLLLKFLIHYYFGLSSTGKHCIEVQIRGREGCFIGDEYGFFFLDLLICYLQTLWSVFMLSQRGSASIGHS